MGELAVANSRAQIIYYFWVLTSIEYSDIILIVNERNTIMDRNEKQNLRIALIEVLTRDVTDDKEFFNKLLYALHIISNELNQFEKKY